MRRPARLVVGIVIACCAFMIAGCSTGTDRQVSSPPGVAAPETVVGSWVLRLGDRDDAEKPAVLSLRLLPAGDIRPVMMPLLPDRAMRLAVSVNKTGDQADCLLTTDAASVDEATAMVWFASLKSAIESPLRLFV